MARMDMYEAAASADRSYAQPQPGLPHRHFTSWIYLKTVGSYLSWSACAAFAQGWAQSLGVLFGLGSAFISTHAFANAIIFMTTYRYEISFPSPHVLPKHKIARAVVSFLGGNILSGLKDAPE